MKNYFVKVVFALILVLLCLSCEDTIIDNNVRILVKGKVIDQNNMPIPGALVEITTDADGLGAVEILLNDGSTDANGEFNITSLFGSNDLFVITVRFQSNFSTYRYVTSTELFRPEDLVFDLGNVELKQLSNFNINIERTSGLGSTLNFSFKYINEFCVEVFEEGVLNINNSNCFEDEIFARILNDNRPNIENGSLRLPLNSEVEFSYSINDGETQTEILTVNSEDYEFTFTY